jgi:hypothetical protein
LLGQSLSKITDEQFHDLTRTFPYHQQPKSARPSDAFTGKKDPQVYDFIVNEKWHQVVFYNTTLDDETYKGTENFKYPVGNYIEADISIACSGEPGFGALGLDPRRKFYVYDFWNEIFIGKISGTDTLTQSLRPGEARMMSIHALENNPQFLSTNRHIMQGYIDLPDITWDERKSELKGISEVVTGETYKIVIACNGRRISGFSAKKAVTGWKISDEKNGLATLSIDSSEGGRIEWSACFK